MCNLLAAWAAHGVPAGGKAVADLAWNDLRAFCVEWAACARALIDEGAVEFPNENHLSRFARLLAAVKKRRFPRYNIGHAEIARLQAGNGGAAILNFGEQKRERTAASCGPASKLKVNQPGGVQLIDCGDFSFCDSDHRSCEIGLAEQAFNAAGPNQYRKFTISTRPPSGAARSSRINLAADTGQDNGAQAPDSFVA
jgi:hypothetical protein